MTHRPRRSRAPVPPRQSASVPLYFLFFCSGLSGLIYQVAWVREFGNVFGNTVYSASLVVAIFMLGLGVGSYFIGIWADRRYATQPESLLRAYGWAEVAIALWGAGLALLLPHLGAMSAAFSSYTRDDNGWYFLSASSYLFRGTFAIVLLTPMTFVMGGTLTLLIRHVVRNDLEAGTRRIAVIYGVNTVGAAVGCFSTDFLLVPVAGLRMAELTAVVMNLVAAVGAFVLARQGTTSDTSIVGRRKGAAPKEERTEPFPQLPRDVLVLTSLALALTGFAAMGMEILWFRHFSLLLGQFRAVFSSVLTVILIGIGLGAFAGGLLHRRMVQPAHWLMLAQGGIVASALFGLATADVGAIHDQGRAVEAALGSEIAWTLAELWFNLRPILAEIGVPAFLMGVAFPLGNALVQLTEQSVGRRAGALYLANTIGSVVGSLATGFVLLPLIGMQASVSVLGAAAILAILPLSLVSRAFDSSRSTAPRSLGWPLVASGILGVGALGVWLQLPSGFVLRRAQALPTGGQVLALSEGVNEVIAVTDTPPQGRALLTNGHPMAGTEPLGQRYMRALAHIPLLSVNNPQSVLVIGFGVGNTAHAATLHPSVSRVDVADLSRHVLDHAGYFSEANRDVLKDRRVSVFVNDGRQHLQMQPADSYDLITLEPPPIAYAGVGALYSREFYALARTRLKAGGYVSQWLPVYQVSPDAATAMIRAFVDVFPNAVLLSGAKADLVLLGARDGSVEIDPGRLASALSSAPGVQADLRRFALGSVREIAGMFIGSSQSLADATRNTSPVTDDRPIQEYSVRSLLHTGRSAATTASASLIDLSQIPAWCPRCFVDGKPVALVEGIDTYLTLLDQFYQAGPGGAPAPAYGSRLVDGSAYLGAILPDSSEVHRILGISMMNRGQTEQAIAEFREAVRIGPDSASAHWQLGKALAARSEAGAVEHLRRSVELGPDNTAARYDLAVSLLEAGDSDEALGHFRAVLPTMPNAAIAYNSLGVALASQGRRQDALEAFQRAINLRPDYAEAQRNLSIVQQGAVPPGFHVDRSPRQPRAR